MNLFPGRTQFYDIKSGLRRILNTTTRVNMARFSIYNTTSNSQLSFLFACCIFFFFFFFAADSSTPPINKQYVINIKRNGQLRREKMLKVSFCFKAVFKIIKQYKQLVLFLSVFHANNEQADRTPRSVVLLLLANEWLCHFLETLDTNW